jgi:hypothetical protein
MQIAIYLISIQIDVESINGTTEIIERNRCVHVQTLFQTKEGKHNISLKKKKILHFDLFV